MRGAIANGDALQATRLDRGLTQEQLAGLAVVDVKTVRKAERGKRLDLTTLTRLAVVLQTDMQSIIRRRQSETRGQADRRKAVEQWQAAWDRRDHDVILGLYHEKAVLELPGGSDIPFSGKHRGKPAIRRANEIAWSVARTVPQKPHEYSLISGDDSVILHGVRGLHLPNGEQQWLTNIHVFTFDGELIIDHRVDFDTLQFAKLLDLPLRLGDPR